MRGSGKLRRLRTLPLTLTLSPQAGRGDWRYALPAGAGQSGCQRRPAFPMIRTRIKRTGKRHARPGTRRSPAAAEAHLRPRPLHVRRHPLPQSRPGPRQPRGHAGDAGVAQARHPLLGGLRHPARRLRRPYRARALQDLAATHLEAAVVGGGAGGLRRLHPAAAHHARGLQPRRGEPRRHRRHLRLRARQPVARSRLAAERSSWSWSGCTAASACTTG